MNPHPTRRAALARAGAGLGALVAAPWAGAQAAARAPLQIVGPWELAGLAPAKSGHVFTRLQIAETLTDAADDGTPLPGLARGWTVSDDGRTWRFALRPAARFHDGSPVDAAAVVRCLQAARTPPSLLSQAPIEAIDAEDAATVRIRLARPHGGLPALLAHSSTLVLAPASFGPDGRVRAIVGSGPYRVLALAPPQQVEAVVFEGYDGPRPAIERVRYLAAGRAETRAMMAQAGQADLAFALDPASVARLRGRPQLQLASVTLPRTILLKLNAGLPALRDLRVRQALSMAIDRVGIARAVLRQADLAATQLLPPTLAGWHDATLPPLRHAPGNAELMLRLAGWRRGPDGLRSPSGQPLSLSLRTFPDRPELPIIATALQEQWRQAGIDVQVSIGNSGDIPLGHRDGSLQLALAARNYATVPDPTGTLQQDFGAQGGDWGAMGWHDAAVVRALDELGRGALSTARRDALRAEVLRTLHTQLPVIPVAWYRLQVAVNRRVAGVRLDPLERSYRLTQMTWTA